MTHDLDINDDYEIELAVDGAARLSIVRAKFLGYEPEVAVVRTLIFQTLDELRTRKLFKEADIRSARKI